MSAAVWTRRCRRVRPSAFWAAGNLARMLALAAARLGFKCHIYAPEADSCAFQVSAAHTVASYQDEQALDGFASSVDVVTYEFENVPADTAKVLEQMCPLAPGSRALATAQDRVDEETVRRRASALPVAPFEAVESVTGADAMPSHRIGTPAILKTRRFGYDGKGQVKLTGQDLAGGGLGRYRQGARHSRRHGFVRMRGLGHCGAQLVGRDGVL